MCRKKLTLIVVLLGFTLSGCGKRIKSKNLDRIEQNDADYNATHNGITLSIKQLDEQAFCAYFPNRGRKLFKKAVTVETVQNIKNKKTKKITKKVRVVPVQISVSNATDKKIAVSSLDLPLIDKRAIYKCMAQ